MLGASSHAQFSYHHAYAPGTTSDFHSDKYGWSVATTEDWIVVGSPFANASAGEVRVYPIGPFQNGTSAVPIALTDTIGPASNQKFGATVDAHGSTIVVGNCSSQGGSEYCGADAAWVSVFTLVDGSWAIVNSGSAFPTGGVLVYADPLLVIDQFASLNARLWPVPATDYLMVDVGGGHPSRMRTIVHDAIGRVVLDQSFTFGNAPVRLDLSSLPAGLCSISILPLESTRPFRALFIRQ